MHTKFNQQLESIEVSQLSDVTGGGLFGAVVKLAEKSAPLFKKAGPYIGHKAVDAAKWTGIPTAVGGGFAWVKHQFSH